MDDEFTEGDFDTIVRLNICQLVSDMAERGAGFDTPEAFVQACETIEHYVTKGGTVSFECAEGSRKFVRGM